MPAKHDISVEKQHPNMKIEIQRASSTMFLFTGDSNFDFPWNNLPTKFHQPLYGFVGIGSAPGRNIYLAKV